jgi:hypothetical protein
VQRNNSSPHIDPTSIEIRKDRGLEGRDGIVLLHAKRNEVEFMSLCALLCYLHFIFSWLACSFQQTSATVAGWLSKRIHYITRIQKITHLFSVVYLHCGPHSPLQTDAFVITANSVYYAPHQFTVNVSNSGATDGSHIDYSLPACLYRNE